MKYTLSPERSFQAARRHDFLRQERDIKIIIENGVVRRGRGETLCIALTNDLDLLDKRLRYEGVVHVMVLPMHEHTFNVIDLASTPDALANLAGPNRNCMMSSWPRPSEIQTSATSPFGASKACAFPTSTPRQFAPNPAECVAKRLNSSFLSRSAIPARPPRRRRADPGQRGGARSSPRHGRAPQANPRLRAYVLPGIH